MRKKNPTGEESYVMLAENDVRATIKEAAVAGIARGLAIGIAVGAGLVVLLWLIAS